MPLAPSQDPGIRRAEILAAFSLATDLAIGQPVEFALKSCALAMRLASETGFGTGPLRETYYQALLRYIGCHAETDAMAALLGDEIAFRRRLAEKDMGNPGELLPLLFQAISEAHAGEPLARFGWNVVKGMAMSRGAAAAGLRAHCETAERLAARLGCDEGVVRNLGQLYERWDGKGLPQGLRGEAIAPAVRVVALAQDVVVLCAAQGLEAAVAAVRKRSGKLYDPRLARVFIGRAQTLVDGLDTEATWDRVLALEPGPQARLTETGFDEACMALGDFADLKSPFTAGHSRAVSALACAAGRRRGLPETDLSDLRRAGWLHDLGQAGTSSGTFAQPRALTDRERESIRLHPYHAERILARPPALARLGEIAARHHERMDGSGYHRGARGDGLTPAARILAAAEVYQALVEARPHRPAFAPADAARMLRDEVRAGRLDSEAAAAVLEAAGQKPPPVRRDQAHGLTARELEILRLAARGRTLREMGAALGIAPKTADNHLPNLYAKIGARTRAGATLFALEHGLLALPG